MNVLYLKHFKEKIQVLNLVTQAISKSYNKLNTNSFKGD
jgi:hypothetical protein